MALGETCLKASKFTGFLSCLGALACYILMTYYVFRNVKDPLKAAYVSNYVFTCIAILLVTVPSFPFAEIKKMRFPVFKKKTIGALVFVAWYMSFATFLISDPVFQLSKHQHDNSAEKAVYPVMVANACGFALASALGLASVVLPGEKAAPPGPAVAEQA